MTPPRSTLEVPQNDSPFTCCHDAHDRDRLRAFMVCAACCKPASSYPVAGLRPAAPIQNQQKLETEIVQIDRLAVTPVAIHRKPEKFVLLLKNLSKDTNAVFELDRQGEETLPIWKLGGKDLWISGLQAAAVIDQTPGVLLLKASGNGRVLCTISIAD